MVIIKLGLLCLIAAAASLFGCSVYVMCTDPTLPFWVKFIAGTGLLGIALIISGVTYEFLMGE